MSVGVEQTWENPFTMSLKNVAGKRGLDSTGIG
jgi:hypothetical protein